MGSSSQIISGVAIGLLLFAITARLADRVARDDADPPMRKFIRWALALKLLAGPAYLALIGAAYGSSGDYERYQKLGSLLAPQFRHGHFHANLGGPVLGTGMVSIVTGVIYAITGVSELAGFVVFSWIGFWGLYFFYRAFRVAFPDSDRRRYAKLVFFLPSMVFWTSAIGKDALMAFGLGLLSYGAARVLMGERRGWITLALGLGASSLVRPHLALAALVAFVPAYVMGRPSRKASNPIGALLAMLALAALSTVMIHQTETFLGLKDLTYESITTRLDQAGHDTTNAGSQSFGNAAASVPLRSPVQFPGAVVTVLFRPFPFEAPTALTLVAAFESSGLLLFSLANLRRVRRSLRRLRRRPYAAFSLLFVGIFVATFSSIGNFGILARERVQVLPMVFVLLAASPADTDQDARMPAHKSMPSEGYQARR